jgi:hypothetical protein
MKIVWLATAASLIVTVFLWALDVLSGLHLLGVVSIILILAGVYSFALAPRRRFDE